MCTHSDNPKECPKLMKDGLGCLEKSVETRVLKGCPYIVEDEVLDIVNIPVVQDFSTEEQELIRERLRRLGYLE